MKYLLTFITLVLNALTSHAEIPIIAFVGVPPQEASPERYNEFKEAGFEVSIDHYWDIPPRQLRNILDIAQSQGVRLMIKSTILMEHPEHVVPYLKGHPALYAYYLEDEPQPAHIDACTQQLNAIRKIDATTRCYINLLPTYGIAKENNEYDNYLRRISQMKLRQISFDHYPILDEGIRADWYHNLEVVRKESLRTGKPFWAFVLCTPHYYYPQPTMASLRLQIYSNLAYGAQAIQYFTYWTPKSYDKYDFHDGPIGIDGKRSKNYELVKAMNSELKQVRQLFDGATILSVTHLLDIPQGTRRTTKMPHHIKKLKVKGHKGCILSTFQNNGHRYLAIVNKDYQHPMSLSLKAEYGVVLIDKTLHEHVLQTNYQVSAGDMLILRCS